MRPYRFVSVIDDLVDILVLGILCDCIQETIYGSDADSAVQQAPLGSCCHRPQQLADIVCSATKQTIRVTE